MNRLDVASSMLVLTACAASDPPVASAARSDLVTDAPPPSTDPGQIDFAEAPAAPRQDVPVQANAPTVVCQLERRTGSNRKVRVCRQQTSATDAAKARAVFDSLRRQQVSLDQ